MDNTQNPTNETQQPQKVDKGKMYREKSDKKNESIPKVDHKSYEENTIPAHIKKIYLDGNNMLFAEDSVRKLTLNHGRKSAE